MPLYSERLSVFLRRVGAQVKSKSKSITTAVFLVFVVLMASAPVKSEAIDQNCVRTGCPVMLKIDDPKAVVIIEKSPEIVPGESVAQRDTRLAAEAQAAAAAAQAAAAKRDAIAREYRAKTVTVAKTSPADPSDFGSIYTAAGAMFDVNPALLKAIHTVETGASGSTSRSNPSGATGPMQFLPSTFRAYGVDGNGDGVKDITNVSDAIFSAAKYLRACGYPDMKKALWGYNPSNSYYNRVMNLAHNFGL